MQVLAPASKATHVSRGFQTRTTQTNTNNSHQHSPIKINTTMRSLAELVQDLPAELYNDILEHVIAVEAEVDIDDGMCLVTTHLKTSSNSIARLQAAYRAPDQSRDLE